MHPERDVIARVLNCLLREPPGHLEVRFGEKREEKRPRAGAAGDLAGEQFVQDFALPICRASMR